jgi:thymidylate synthase ThyX
MTVKSANGLPATADPPATTPAEQSEAEVFAVFGAEPEVQAYAMAKYSRSALSMKESLAEINEQKAEKFLNTFYFQYGHRSIADLAHIALAVEKLSILAAIVLVDEQRWDGQERSTRYQDFKKSGYYFPEIADRAARDEYRATADFLFSEYEAISGEMFRYLAAKTPKPEDMKQEAYDRTLKARAFDLSRYLLPLATNTSLGQIVNARTLETQVARLLSSPYAEVRKLGEKLKQAASNASYNVNQAAFAKLVAEIAERDPDLAARAEAMLLKPVRSAPTLVKYATPNRYETDTRAELRMVAERVMELEPIEPAVPVDLLEEDEPLEIELPTTLLYEHCHYPYRQVRRRVQDLAAKLREEIVDTAAGRLRGRHDELLRAFSAGQKFRFDILQDIGGFRDMHRHRRCVQIHQEFTAVHGYDTPEDMVSAGLQERYDAAMKRAAGGAARIASRLADMSAPEPAESAQYLLPLAYRKRTLFKMDFSEVVYISELRTGPAGHFSYRNVAYAMYEAVAKRHPSLAQYFRVTDVREPVDLLKR